MTTPKRPLHAVPESDTSTTTEKEHPDMNSDHNPSPAEDTAQPVRIPPRPGGMFEVYNDLFCAVLGLVLDAVAVLAAVVYYRNGVIPTWLDSHGGHWAWLGAGAITTLFVFGELPDTLARLNDAMWELDEHRTAALTARIDAALAADTDGGEQR